MTTKAELKTQIEKLQAEYDAMPDDVVLNGRAALKELYYYVATSGGAFVCCDYGSEADKSCHKIGNYYLTESVANRAAAYYKKWGQFNRVAFELMENDECEPNETKRHITIFANGRWEVHSSIEGPHLDNGHYFKDKNNAQRLADWANLNMPEG